VAVLNLSVVSGESLFEADRTARTTMGATCEAAGDDRERRGGTSLRASGRGAVENFYLREFRAVVGLAYLLSGRSMVAEDIAQEAFMAAHRAWERVARYDDPGAWVRKVAANKASKVLRNRGREAQARLRLALKRGMPPGVYELPSEHAEVAAAVRALPKRQRQVIALHYYADYTVSEVATALKIAEGTVKAHLHQARTVLQQRLGPGTEPAP
jgi:RNA polymerase sigma-70 factor (ECF subfamily)